MGHARPEIDAAVRRTVGVATLRRLHRMIAEERDGERRDARIALLIGVCCAVTAAVVIALLALR